MDLKKPNPETPDSPPEGASGSAGQAPAEASPPEAAAPGNSTAPAIEGEAAEAAPLVITPRHRGRWLGTVQSLAEVVVIAVFVITFIVQAFQIPSESMENTLLIGDFLLVDKVHDAQGGKWGHILPYTPIRRDDVIVFRYPVNPRQHFVKRVIGVPGDRIRMKDRQVFVNGQPLLETYVVHRIPGHDDYRDDFPQLDAPNFNQDPRWWSQLHLVVHNGELVVPPDRYFVLGDNRDESLDSRYWGFVPRENIIGRPLLIYWSIHHTEQLEPVTETAGDKLWSFAYTVTHAYREIRWNRVFRRVE
jgi:signal peptidase I